MESSVRNSSTENTQPASEEKLSSRTVELLMQWPVFSFILKMGSELYLLIKNVNIFTRWTCTSIEKIVHVILESLERLPKPVRSVVGLADLCLTENLQQIEQKFPIVKDPPQKVLEAIEDRIRTVSALLAQKAAEMTSIGRKRVRRVVKSVVKFSRTIIKIVESSIDALDSAFNPRRRTMICSFDEHHPKTVAGSHLRSKRNLSEIYEIDESTNLPLDPTIVYKLENSPKRLDATDISKIHSESSKRRLDPTDIYKLDGESSERRLDPTDIYKLDGESSTRRLDPTDIYKIDGESSTRRLDPTDIYKLGGESSERRLDPTDIYKLEGESSERRLDPTDIYKLDGESGNERLDPTNVYRVGESPKEGRDPSSVYRFGVSTRKSLDPTNVYKFGESESEEPDPANVEAIAHITIDSAAKIGYFFIGAVCSILSKIPFVGNALEDFTSPSHSQASSTVASPMIAR